MFVPLSVLEFRDRAETFYGDKVGVVDGDRKFTYRSFGERTHRLANALHELGVVPGDRVSFITYNTHHLLEAYYGVLEAGAILNPVNIRLTAGEIGYILGHAGSKVVFFHRDFRALVETIAAQLEPCPRFVILDGEAGGVATDEYEALLADGSPDPLDWPVEENAIAELFYTSGTTGFPKGVAMTHRELYLHALYAEIGLGFGEDDVVLHTVPLFHVNGWGTPHFLTMVGGRHVMLRKFEPVALMQAVQRHGVSRILAVPAIFNAVLHHHDRASYDLSSLHQLIKDRSKDIIIRGGENISSVEVENAILAHPAVLECAVVSAPDRQLGEAPVALVVLKPGAEATARELREFCRARLARFKVPRDIHFRDSLPKGGTGKILKAELREPFWKGHESRVQ